MTKCEGCEQEKEVTDIEGNLLCKECAEDSVRCGHCDRYIGINFDELEIDNYGTLGVPELSLPDKQAHLVFCNVDCLEEYVKKCR